MANGVDIIQQTTAYRGYFRIKKYQLRYKLFAGDWSKTVTREVFERGHAASVLLYDPALEKVVLTEQFRIGALGICKNPWMLGLVAGIIEPGENATDVVIREAQEEAGETINELLPICTYFSSVGGSSEQLTLFCAKVDSTKSGGIHGLQEEAEDIKIHVIDVEDAFNMLETNQIQVADATIALRWLQVHFTEVNQRWG